LDLFGIPCDWTNARIIDNIKLILWFLNYLIF
jgi:hypothetical protein